MKDLTNRADIVRLIDAFYSKVLADELLSPVFAHVDWPKHMPTMYNFWSSMMLGDQTYQANPFQKHVHLPIKATHFKRWLELFTATVDEHFKGDQAEKIKSRAWNIAVVFQHKLGLNPTDD